MNDRKRLLGFKMEIGRDGMKGTLYTDKDSALDCIRDVITYTETYQQTKWWQFIKQALIVERIRRKAEDLYHITSEFL